MKKSAYMIIDLQFGSTGKGLLAGVLAKTYKPDVVVTAWGPNAGHTYIDENGRTFIHRMLANGIVSPNLKTVLIGPGSVIDLKCLKDEILGCIDIMKGKTIIIHPNSVVVTDKHLEEEKANVKIGSTMKGTGAAVIDRIKRDPDNMPVASACISVDWMIDLIDLGVTVVVRKDAYDNAIRTANLIQIEGAQGYSLSIYHGFYPYTTSRDVSTAQVLADTGMPWNMDLKVYGTLRTFPIRVANRYDSKGNMIGTSGPCYRDQVEMKWQDLGMEPELTTVTKLPRRIFSFSYEQTREAIFRCKPDFLFLNFANYADPEDIVGIKNHIQAHYGNTIDYVGVGPNHSDVLTYDMWEDKHWS